MAQKPVLGKGLASLFPTHSQVDSAGSVSVPVEAINRDRHPGISLALVDEIHANPYQPRREFDEAELAELAASIQANGVIQPLIVRKRAAGGYELIAGERRLRAAKKAGQKQVPIVIRKSTDREALELALIENIQRSDLNCIEIAMSYSQLMQEFSLTQEEMAARVGKDRATVANHLRLLRLPEAIVDDLKKGILTFGHGKAILGVDDQDLRLLARAEIVQKRLSVRDAEALVDALKKSGAAALAGSSQGTNAEEKPISPARKRLDQVSQEMTRKWTARVEIKGSERKGKIVIHYANRAELERLIERALAPSTLEGKP